MMLLFASLTDNAPSKKKLKVDDTLILRIAEGDKEAFTALYKQTANIIYAYALTILKNSEDAEDVLQDTFLKIRSAASLYHPQGKLLAWIISITKNLCMMKLRRQKFVSNIPIEDIPLKSPVNHINNAEDQLVLQTALNILSDDECQIITMHAITGWKHREIAELLHLPLPTVLSKYHRGLTKLKTELEGKL